MNSKKSTTTAMPAAHDANIYTLTEAQLRRRADRVREQAMAATQKANEVAYADLFDTTLKLLNAGRRLIAIERKAREDAEATLQDERDRADVREVLGQVRSILPKYVRNDEQAIRFATFELKQYVLGLDDDEVGDPEKVVEDWAKKFVAGYPEFARRKVRTSTKEAGASTASPSRRPRRSAPADHHASPRTRAGDPSRFVSGAGPDQRALEKPAAKSGRRGGTRARGRGRARARGGR